MTTLAEIERRIADLEYAVSQNAHEFAGQSEEEAVAIARAALLDAIKAVVEDSERLDWIEANHTLHKSVEFLYVVDGYECLLLQENGRPDKGYRGETLRAAIDATRRGDSI